MKKDIKGNLKSNGIKWLLAALFVVAAVVLGNVGVHMTANAEDNSYVNLYKNGDYVAQYSNINQAFDAITDSSAEYIVEISDDQILSGYEEWPQAKKITIKETEDMEYESYFRLGSNKANFNSDVMIYEGIRIKKSDDTSTTNYKLNLKNHTLTLGEKRNGVIYIAGDIEGSEGSKIETNTVTQIRALVNVDIIEQNANAGDLEIMELSDEKMHISQWHTHGNSVSANGGNIEVDYMDAQIGENYYTTLTFMECDILVHEIKAGNVAVNMSSMTYIDSSNISYKYKQQVRYTGDYDGEVDIRYTYYKKDDFRNYNCNNDISTLFYAPNLTSDNVQFEYKMEFDISYRYTSYCEKKDGMYVPVRMPADIFIDDRYFNVTENGHYEKEMSFSDEDDIENIGIRYLARKEEPEFGIGGWSSVELDKSDTSIKAVYKDGKICLDVNDCKYKTVYIEMKAKYNNGIVEIEIPVNIVTPIKSIYLDKSYVEFNDRYFNDYSYIINLTYDKGDYPDAEEKVIIYQTGNSISFITEKTDNGYVIKVSAMRYGEDTLKVVVNDKECECKFKVGLYTDAYVESNFWGTVQNLTVENTRLYLEESDQRTLRVEPEVVFEDEEYVKYNITMQSADPSIVKVDNTMVNKCTITALKQGSTYITIKGDGFEKIVPVTVTAKSEPEGPKNGLYRESDGNYYYYVDNVVNTAFTDLVQYHDQWYYVENGKVNYNYNDLFYSPTYGWWKVAGGVVDFGYTDLYYSPSRGWWKITGGQVDFGYSDIYYSPSQGWWKIAGGQVDFGYSDIYYSPQYGWWKIAGGQVDFGYSDIYYSPQYGWWKIAGGQVDFGYSDIYYSPQYGWWKVTGGQVDFNYSDLYYSPQYGWWKISGGAVDFDYSGMYNSPQYGSWNIAGGSVMFN